jgi:hypothetical protein
VNREEIAEYTAAIGEEMTEHIDFVIDAMRGIADTLELQGGGLPGYCSSNT